MFKHGRLIYALALVFLFIAGCNELPSGGSSSNTPGTQAGGPGGSAGGGANGGNGEGEDGNINGPGGGGNDGGNADNLVTDTFTQSNFSYQYDLLWVIDNSGSMNDNRAVMVQNINNFLTILQSRQSLDWQMAVTNTDAVDTAGNLIAGSGGVRVVTSQMANSSATWASIINNIVNTPHSFWEQGLESGWKAIANYASEFSRTNVPLVVAYVSDEQDYSCASNCHNYSTSPEGFTDVVYHPLSRYTDQYTQVAQSRGTEVISHSIVHLSPIGVPGACDTSGSMGARYMSLATSWPSGTANSLCPNDMAASFNDVAQLVADLGVCFTLLHTLDSMDDFEVKVNGNVVSASASNGYVYEAPTNAVCFTGTYIPQNGQVITVRYHRVLGS